MSGSDHDLQQWCTGAIEVEPGHAVKVLVQRLAGVLFQVGAGDADALDDSPFELDIEIASPTTGSSYWLIW
jgi:hypothetical protein